MNSVSRNRPTALVIGCAGFLGSHVVDCLLNKEINVLGFDNLSSGSMDNLVVASGNNHFQFIRQSLKDANFENISRIDYGFFVVSEDIPKAEFIPLLENFLEVCKKHKTKIVLASTVRLYDQQDLKPDSLVQAEKMLAKYALDNKTNARIVRLTAIYGPRMHFREDDPLIKLLHDYFNNPGFSFSEPPDFTTRAIFVSDAADLLIKTLMHSGTAQKIYDGALLFPISLLEVKNILLDPLWHEKTNFVPTKLPTWATPNSLKTQKELSWKPTTSLLSALKETVAYFKSNPDKVPKKQTEEIKGEVKPNEGLAIFPSELVKSGPKKYRINLTVQPLLSRLVRVASLVLGIGFIIYALIYPLGLLVWNTSRISPLLRIASEDASVGEFDKALIAAQKAHSNISDLVSLNNSLMVLHKINFLSSRLDKVDQALYILSEASGGYLNAINGTKGVYEQLKVLSGENPSASSKTNESSLASFVRADSELSYAEGKLSESALTIIFPSFLYPSIEELKSAIISSRELISEGKSASFLLTQLTSVPDKRRYLVVVLDNTTLRPAGGTVVAYGEVEAEKGRVINIKVDSVDNLDQSFSESILPPKELKDDLEITKLTLKDTAYDPDFSAAAIRMKWFYDKEAKTTVSGVIALDLTGLQKLMETTGVLEIDGQKIDQNMFLQKIITESDRKLLTKVLKEELNRLLFVPNQNWPQIVQTLSGLTEEKHLMSYFVDPTLFSFATSSGWNSVLPRGLNVVKGKRNEFLAVFEENIGDRGVNLYVKRNFDINTTIAESGNVSHILQIKYANQSSSILPPQGSYKTHLKVFLTSGSKLTSAKWGDLDVTSKISSFSDYGRAGYSVILDLSPKEQKVLKLEYSDASLLDFENGNNIFSLNVVKQPGALNDPFTYTVNIPSNLRIAGKAGSEKSMNFTSPLSKNQLFQTTLHHP